MSTEPAEDAKQYDLFTRDSATRVVWRLEDEGIAIEADALVLRRAGQWTRAPYDKILSVTLASGSVGRGNTIGSCTILMSNGGRIIVSNVNRHGGSDGSRDGIYRRFVADFHKQLIAATAVNNITFHSGYSQGRMTGLLITLAFMTVFFVLTPLVLFIASHDMQGLWITLAGAGLVFPFYRVASTNRPARYNPGAPPDLLP